VVKQRLAVIATLIGVFLAGGAAPKRILMMHIGRTDLIFPE